jgi:hypothetical protein
MVQHRQKEVLHLIKSAAAKNGTFVSGVYGAFVSAA